MKRLPPWTPERPAPRRQASRLVPARRSAPAGRPAPTSASVLASVLAAVSALVWAAAPLLAQAPPAAKPPPLSWCPNRVVAFGEVEGTLQELRTDEGSRLVLKLGDGRRVVYSPGNDLRGFKVPVGTRVKVAVTRTQSKEEARGEPTGGCVTEEIATAIWPASGPPPDPCPERTLAASDVEGAFEAIVCGSGCRLAMRLDDGRTVEIPVNDWRADEFRAPKGTRIRVAARREQHKRRVSGLEPIRRCAARSEATNIELAADFPPPPPPEHPGACPRRLLAKEEVVGPFLGAWCEGRDCLLQVDLGNYLRGSYRPEGRARNFKAREGVMVKVEAERYQEPGRGRSAGRCLIVDVAKTITTKF